MWYVLLFRAVCLTHNEDILASKNGHVSEREPSLPTLLMVSSKCCESFRWELTSTEKQYFLVFLHFWCFATIWAAFLISCDMSCYTWYSLLVQIAVVLAFLDLFNLSKLGSSSHLANWKGLQKSFYTTRTFVRLLVYIMCVTMIYCRVPNQNEVASNFAHVGLS